MNADLIKAYTETDYIVLPLDLTIKVGKVNRKMHSEMLSRSWSTYSIMTAWNPRSVEAPYEENILQNLKMLKDLVEEDAVIFPALGKHKGNIWKPEESWCVINLSKEKCLELARKYDQNAIVFGTLNDEAELLYCFE